MAEQVSDTAHELAPRPTVLREPARRVSPRAKWMWALSELIGAVIGAAIVTFVWSRDWIPDFWFHLGFGFFVLEGLLGALVLPWWRYKVHRWEVTDDAVHTQRGRFVVERRIAPMVRIQTVDTERGPLAQLFGLSTVTVTTASASGELKIEGLDRAEADDLAQQLTVLAAVDGGDGT